MADQCSYKGFWILICDCETASITCTTGIETISESLRKLQKKLPELFPIPPKAIKNYGKDNILVFTSNDSYEEIKRSAEAIRSNVHFPFIMYYKKRSFDSKSGKSKYMHTPENELYEQMDKINYAKNFWTHISQKTNQAAAFDELLPSEVTDKDYIHLPAKTDDFERAKNEKGGKWMLHCSDLEKLDSLWENLIRLYDKGILVGLKSSTVKFSVPEIYPTNQTRAIMCYTADAGCKYSVKRAAEGIFICTGYNFVMYYKSNKASQNGHYCHEGFRSVSMYMFTSTGEMFQKDPLNRWRKIIFDEEKEKIHFHK